MYDAICAAALIRVPEAFLAANAIERVILASLRDASELLRRLLDGGHTVVAGGLAGALRGLGRGDAADEIVITMKAAGYDVRESDPFAGRAPETGTPTIMMPTGRAATRSRRAATGRLSRS